MAAAAAPEAYAKKAQVEYLDASGNWVAATVVSVAFDDKLVPYYEVGRGAAAPRRAGHDLGAAGTRPRLDHHRPTTAAADHAER